MTVELRLKGFLQSTWTFYVILILCKEVSSTESSTCPRSCDNAEFQCSNCECIPSDWKCDRENDCVDGEDEPANCTFAACLGSEFSCGNEKCVFHAFVCDGDNDCGDNSDELHCGETYHCEPGEWACPDNGKCIPLSQVCDRTNHCDNGGDEGTTCGNSMCGALSCDHGCAPTPTGGKCYCKPGYALDSTDNRTCIDYDECHVWGRCDQLCKDNTGYANCSCRTGYNLVDGHTCTANSAVQPRLYYLKEGKILNSDVNGQSVKTVFSLANATSLDYHYPKQKVYWVNRAARKIYEADIDNGGSLRAIPLPGIEDPVAVAVDWIGDHLYVVDKGTNKIDMVSLDGMHRKNVISFLSKPSDVALDPNTGFLFYADLGGQRRERHPAEIGKAFMDGSMRTRLVRDKIYAPQALSIDYVKQLVYWTDSHLDQLSCIDYYGRHRKTIMAGRLNLPHPHAVSLFENMAYISDWTRLSMTKVNVYKGEETFTTLVSDSHGNRISDLTVVHPLRQTNDRKACTNMTCEHLCVLTHTTDNKGLGYRCLCDTGYKLNDDLTSCSRIEKFLIFSSLRSIRGVPLEENPARNVEAITPVTGNSTNFVGLDFDAEEDYIYFSEVKQDIIWRAHRDGTGKEIVVGTGIRSVEGISVDWIAKNLYYTDSMYRVIGVVRLTQHAFQDKQQRNIISDLGNPRAIVIHARFGILFWTEWLRNTEQKARIGRAYSDGTNVTYIREHELGWPNGLSLDYRLHRLWWADAMFDVIQHSKYDGTDVQTLRGPKIAHPFGLVVYGDYVYFTDWRLEAIIRAEKNFPTRTEVIWKEVDKMYSVKIFDHALQDKTIVSNPCKDRNGDCDGFCFARVSTTTVGDMEVFRNVRRHCGCPYGKKINSQDQRSCIADPGEPEQQACPAHTFQCDNGRCVAATYRCDGDDDCFDDSDERQCQAHTCAADQTRCDNGKCIPARWRCDGDNDCGDMSDESDCPAGRSCAVYEFSCDNGLCVGRSAVCDTENDCMDGSDETIELCAAHTCDVNKFQCRNGRCVPQQWRCDGDNDCSDNSDEEGCGARNCSRTNEFQCRASGACIRARYRCDLAYDCSDGSDEAGCPDDTSRQCRDNEFRCDSGTCVPQNWKCDKHEDCADGTDERGCPPATCPPNYFKCDNDRCVSRNWLCDGDNDCGDGSDEDKRHNCAPPPFKCKAWYQWECPGGLRVCINRTQICDGREDCPGGHDESDVCNEDTCANENGGCSHVCRMTPYGATCFCPPGMTLNGTRTCVDENECLTPSTCSQVCVDMKGSYKCECTAGYTLMPDRRTCKVENGSETPYVLVSDKATLMRISLDGNFNSFIADLSNLNMTSIVGIGIDTKLRDLYWSDSKSNKIFTSKLDGSGFKELISSGVDLTEAIAIDWVARNMYWTDYVMETIEVASLGNLHRTVLFSVNVTNPRAVVLDPRETDRRMFWSDWGRFPRIESAGMDGSDRKVIVSEKLYWPNGLALDLPARRMYFTDARLDYIEFCNYDGSGRTTLIADDHFLLHPHGLAVFEDFIYWTDVTSKSLNRCDKFSCNNQTFVNRRLKRPLNVIIAHSALQPDAVNPCSQTGCSHLCLLSPVEQAGYKCACPTGMKIGTNRHSCIQDKSEFIMFLRQNHIAGIPLDATPEVEGFSTAFVPIMGITNGNDFDYDSKEGVIYWVEYNRATRQGSIHKVKLNGQNRTTFVPTGIIGAPYSLAIDWVSRNMYFGNLISSTIEVIRLDGEQNYRKVLLTNTRNATGVARPIALAVDPIRGKLYWLDGGGIGVPRKVAMMNLDGSEPEIIVQHNLYQLNFIHLDITENVLYWSEGFAQKIEKYMLNTRQREQFLGHIHHPRGIVTRGGKLYYSDPEYETITEVGSDGSNPRVMKRNLALVGQIRLYRERHLDASTNACSGNNGGCEQLCLIGANMQRTCACATGYKLHDNGVSCTHVTSFLVVSHLTGIRGFDLTPEHAEAMVPVGGQERNALYIETDFKNNFIYWSNLKQAKSNSGIYRIRPDGTGFEGVVTDGIGSKGVHGLTIDWLAGNLYFVNKMSPDTYVEVCRLDGSRRLVLVKSMQDSPVTIAVNPIRRLLYWADSGQTPKIEKALLDGSNRTKIVTTGIAVPRDLTIDFSTGHVYWVDSVVDAIQRISYSGGNRLIIRSNLPNPYGIALYGGKIYWVDRSLKQLLAIPQNPGNSSSRPETVRAGIATLKDIAVFDSSTQPQDATNPCQNGNGGCQQLCFAMPQSTVASCACATGILAADGRTCTKPLDYLVFAMETEVRGLYMDEEVSGQPFTPITGLNGAVGVDYSYEQRLLVISQVSGKKLSTVKMNSTSVTDIIDHQNSTGGNTNQEVYKPDGIAYDWINRKVYWTDQHVHRIFSMNLDATHRTTVMVTHKPRAIVLDPCRGFMYYSDWGQYPRIERASLSGRNQKILVGTNIGWPNGLNIDHAESRLYWADALYDKIERSDMEGNYREVIVQTATHPFGLAVYGHHIYWTDWQLKGVFRAEKHTGANQRAMMLGLPKRPMDIHVVSRDRQQQCDNPCENNNGGCSHICHPGPEGEVECSCPDFSNLRIGNGGKMCVPWPNNCTDEQFVCDNGRCTSRNFLCDLDNDCGDGSDESEQLCADFTCDPAAFVCGNGRCIPQRWRCDYDNDCRDNTDELDCPFPTCGPDQFTCKNSRCIAAAQVCDGRDNCRDGNFTDEIGCPPVDCRSGYVKCSNNNICIRRRWLCDGDNDCGDNADEEPLFCASHECDVHDFRCTTHRCIPAAWHCDGDNDCGDGTDELPEVCNAANRTCYGNQFTCNNGNCISEMWVCDGDDDCSDNSDEAAALNCAERTCPPHTFYCNSSREAGHYPCVDRAKVCDGERDCLRGEDEMQDCPPVTCKAGQYQCAIGFCISEAWVCDRDNDCGDYSDEPANCTYSTCGAEEFTCDNGRCIPKQYRCDGDNDCLDNSDEKEDFCLTPEPTCPGGQFLCDNGRCIAYEIVCNKNDDCGDQSDEPPHCYVNECDDIRHNQCQHTCVDTITSYYCKCHDGFTLMSDRKACRDVDECVERPEVCTQFCENTPGGYLCKCDEGYMKAPQSGVCKKKDDVEPWLVFTNRYYLRKLSVDGHNYELLYQGLNNAVAMDFDVQEERLYFVDVQANKIQRILWNGTELETLVWQGIPGAEGLAVDWIGRKMYWNDNKNDRMYVSELNGTSQRVLINNDLTNPRAIAVHPFMGYVYWTDWGLAAYIGRIGMDGTNRSKVVTEKLGWPNGFTIDYVTNRMWWVDAHLDYIEFADLDGRNRHTVLQGSVPHPFSITLFEEWMYWTDWNHKTIEKANRFTGENRVILRNITHRPMAIHLVHPLKQLPGSGNPCGQNNGGCSHLCLISPGGGSYKCVCPDYFLLAPDARTCIANCSSSQFRCGVTDDRCISLLWKCDGEKDCRDGADEPEDCPVRHCPPGQFQCQNLNCTFPFKICDGNDDCGDATDETDCASRVCEPWQYRCSNGKCIPRSWACDEDRDCADGSDEAPLNAQCGARSCDPHSQFTCDNGRCISNVWVCDYDNDCGDNSDEMPVEKCRNTECQEGWSRCETNYRCIPDWALCDGSDDCRDGSDERPDRCPKCHATGDFHCANRRCIPKRWQCDFDNDCGDNSDENPAMCASMYRACSESEFRCANHKCIPGRWRCDHDNDCGDGSDEVGCAYRGCLEGQFRCASGHCVNARFVCDGDKDCEDSSDELNCTTRYPDGRFCPANKFECRNTVCISPEWRCDGDDDCGDASDETPQVCQQIDCPQDFRFRCNNFKCIPKWRLCDKVDNCGDGSDENDHDLCEATRRPSECAFEQFKCANRRCVRAMAVCDERDDCGDASDERGCHKQGNDQGCSINYGGCEQNCTTLPSNDGYVCHCLDGFSVSDEDKTSCVDVDECATWGHRCPQNCLNVKGAYKCTCDEGFVDTSRGRGRTCRAEGKRASLFFAVGHEIRRYIPQAKNFEYSDAVIAGRRIEAMDFDPLTSIIYWADSSLKTIQRALVPNDQRSTGFPQDLRIDVTMPSGVAFDYVTKVLFWTDRVRGEINCAKEDGRYKRTLIKSTRFNPSAIVLHPGMGWMFWTDTYPLNPKIEAAWMNGQNRTVLADARLGNPTGLAIDTRMNNRLYWCDSKENIIESMNIDGTDRVIVAAGRLANPFSLDVFENNMYWVSLQAGKVISMDKFGRGVNQTVQAGLLMPKAVKVFHRLRYDIDIKNRCESLKCHPLCVHIPNGATCLCPNDSEFLPGSNKACNMHIEAPKSAPQGCPCGKNGVCVPSPRDSDQLVCSCHEGYHGTHCEYGPTYRAKSSRALYALVPVCLLAVAVFIVILLVLLWKRRGLPWWRDMVIGYRKKMSGMSGSGEFRTGLPGIVTFHGDNNVDLNGSMNLEEQVEPPMIPMESEFQSSDLNPVTNFSNPMYESYGNAPPEPSPPPAEEVTLGDISTASPEISPSPSLKKRGFFSRGAAKSPSPKKHVTFPQVTSKVESEGGVKEGSEGVRVFNPTTVETDKDTQALVEEDDGFE